MKNNKIRLSVKQKEVVYGTLLGDGWLETATNGRTYRFGFKQKYSQKDYVHSIYHIFDNLCGSPAIPNGTDIQFKTLTLPCFRFYGHQFYGKNHVKKVPKLIHRWLTPRALAYWYMDDGYKHTSGCYLYTNGFEKADVQRLCIALQNRFQFDCGIRTKSVNGQSQWFIYITSKSFKSFCFIVQPYIISSMRYKLYTRRIKNKK
jgi:LAGLIDADG DNA endonuclease family